MNMKKIAVILIALFAGGAAFYLAMVGQGGGEPATVPIIQAAKEETINVLVAKSDISRGQSLTQDNTVWKKWPKKTVSGSTEFITDNDDNPIAKLEGVVAKNAFVAGEPLIERKVVRSGGRGLLAALIPPGMVAVSLRVNSETAAGGFILPGDHVDIAHNISGGRGKKSSTSTLFRDVRVVAVNEDFSENPETAFIDGVNITLEMTPYDAERFIAARSEGTLSLLLRSLHDGEQQAKPGKKKTAPAQRKVKIVRIGRA